jgi:predicted AlkP superfamily pyrophosphatase or phosphodiesterase
VASLVQGFALWLFCGGFLLSRVSVPLTSSAISPVIQLPAAKVHPKLFKKAVIIIVDALRLDFLVEQPYSRHGNHVASMQGVLRMAKSLV